MDLGTAVGVISLGIQVLEGIVDYYSAYKDYGDDIASLCTSSVALLPDSPVLAGPTGP